MIRLLSFIFTAFALHGSAYADVHSIYGYCGDADHEAACAQKGCVWKWDAAYSGHCEEGKALPTDPPFIAPTEKHKIECYARDSYLGWHRAVGYDWPQVQRSALDMCWHSVGRGCRAAGCHRLFR